MNRNRASRTRLLTAAATVALAALSLTACNDGSGVKDEGASSGSSTTVSPTASPTAGERTDDAKPAPDTPAASDTADTANAPAAKSPAAKAPAKNAPAASTRTVTCEGSTTRTVAAPLTRPVNHMLLTVTNTGSNTCYLYGYPAARFGEAQSVPPVDEDTKPQAVVTLKPGESGYASVRLSAADGSGSNGYTAKTLSVYFQGRSGNESVGSGATPALPAKGLYVDDSLEVTYWQQSMDSVLGW
ncbi:DUF4232 domain-containing protein [Streptomyces kunmingensis]|uniref:DUF4232 domain-containing protein n=1 Tax=Streptomyces kunmingensis TaxID=68225 RepID=A0ABU6CRV6_9ACTN|nr:DUF4232 domain-containing protein [Streptomyces kunmingensis]MEB3966676.1 DUF4232 domain-containing protein [Streptomyces kunmingensis]